MTNEEELEPEEDFEEELIDASPPLEEPEDEELISINYRGEEVMVTKEKAIALAQKGFDYESKMASLKETSQDIAGYEAMREWMAENPDEAAKVRAIIAGQAEEPQETEEHDDEWLDDFADEEETPRRAEQRNKSNEEVETLKRQVAELREERERKKAEAETKRMGDVLRAEVAKYPALEEFGELAFGPILGVLSTRPDADVTQVVKAVAEQFQEASKRIRSGYVKKKAEKLEEADVESLRGSQPTILRKKTFGKDDLDSGDLRRAVLTHLTQDEE